MHRVKIAESILSAVTDADRAAALAGDLSEEGASRGPLWFWLSLLTAFSRLLPRLAGRALAAWLLQILVLTGTAPLLFWLHAPGAGYLAVPFVAVVCTAWWLARRSPGQELASCLLCNLIGYLISTVTLSVYLNRIELPNLNGLVLMDLAMIPVAICVRSLRERRAHA